MIYWNFEIPAPVGLIIQNLVAYCGLHNPQKVGGGIEKPPKGWGKRKLGGPEFIGRDAQIGCGKNNQNTNTVTSKKLRGAAKKMVTKGGKIHNFP